MKYVDSWGNEADVLNFADFDEDSDNGDWDEDKEEFDADESDLEDAWLHDELDNEEDEEE